MNNKKVIGLLIGGIVVLGSAPYFVGDLAREKLQEQAASISEVPGYTVNITAYEQGWFTSHATIEYGFDDHMLRVMAASMPEGTPEDAVIYGLLKEGLSYDIKIAHGPITFQDGLNFALMTFQGRLNDVGHEAYATFKQKAKIDDLMILKAKVSYGGSTTVHTTSPAFNVEYLDSAGGKIHVASGGIESEATFSADLSSYDVTLALKKLDINGANLDISLGPVEAVLEGEKINDHLWLGSGVTNIGELTLNVPSGAITLKALTSDYNLSQESDTALSLTTVLLADEFTVPNLSVKEFALDFNANHLDLDALTDYVQSIQALYQTEGSAQPTELEIATKTQVIAARVGEKLIKGSPEVIINSLNFRMGEGFFKGNSTLKINGDNLESIQQLSEPRELNKRLINSTDIAFDKPLAEAIMTLTMRQQMAAAGMDLSAMPAEQLSQAVKVQTSMMLQQFVTQGYVLQEGETFRSHFELKDGQRLINGKALALPGM